MVAWLIINQRSHLERFRFHVSSFGTIGWTKSRKNPRQNEKLLWGIRRKNPASLNLLCFPFGRNRARTTADVTVLSLSIVPSNYNESFFSFLFLTFSCCEAHCCERDGWADYLVILRAPAKRQLKDEWKVSTITNEARNSRTEGLGMFQHLTVSSWKRKSCNSLGPTVFGRRWWRHQPRSPHIRAQHLLFLVYYFVFPFFSAAKFGSSSGLYSKMDARSKLLNRAKLAGGFENLRAGFGL